MSESFETPTPQARQWAMFCHLAGLVICCIPMLGSLAIWKLKEAESPFIADQGKEAVNWHLSYFIVAIGLTIAGYVIGMLPLVGRLFWIVQLAVFAAWVIMTIMGSLKANAGEKYRYPYNFRFIK